MSLQANEYCQHPSTATCKCAEDAPYKSVALLAYEHPNLSEYLSQRERVHNIAIEKLTCEQTAECLRQAIACGDFQRNITQDGRQAVVYIPFREVERLKVRIAELEKILLQKGYRDCL